MRKISIGRILLLLCAIWFITVASAQAQSSDPKPATITPDKCVSLCLGIAGGSEGGCAVIVPGICAILNAWNAEIGFAACTAVAEIACLGGSGGVEAACTGICNALARSTAVPEFPIHPRRGLLFE